MKQLMPVFDSDFRWKEISLVEDMTINGNYSGFTKSIDGCEWGACTQICLAKQGCDGINRHFSARIVPQPRANFLLVVD